MKRIRRLLIAFSGILLLTLLSILSVQAEHIGWGNVEWPPAIYSHPAGTPTGWIYGQVWIDGITGIHGQTPYLIAELGYGSTSDPSGWSNWVSAIFNLDVENNDEFMAQLTPIWGGNYNYAYRYSYESGPYVYCDIIGIISEERTSLLFGFLEVIGPSPPSPIPEPSTMLLLGSGLIGLLGYGRKRFLKK